MDDDELKEAWRKGEVLTVPALYERCIAAESKLAAAEAVVKAAREWDAWWKPSQHVGQAMADWKLHEALVAYDRTAAPVEED